MVLRESKLKPSETKLRQKLKEITDNSTTH